MAPRGWVWLAAIGGLVALLSFGAVLLLSRLQPEVVTAPPPALPPPLPLNPTEPVQTLAVTLDLGPGGDLSEPVALDLGLGFPFWLEPIGRGPSEPPPFGALPHASSGDRTVAAGSSITCTFSAVAPGGTDALAWTPQLLAGVRVADLTRVGFASRGTGKWELAGYQVYVNDRLFASGKGLNVKAAQVVAEANTRLAKLGLECRPLEHERDQLLALVQAQLARRGDTQRLAEVENQLASLLPERRRLEAVVRGSHPWFLAPPDQFTVSLPARGPAVRSAQVKLLTDTHAGADTLNYVYFRTGARKYLLGGPDRPLCGFFGPQEFPLDLLAGPLTAADVQGWMLGALAHTARQGTVPDRYHPCRLLVEIDGRVVYDSDEVPADHLSLEATRLIPPCHRNGTGEVVANVPGIRETHLWAAGSNFGIDLAHKEPLPLVGRGPATAPRAEDRLVEVAGDEPVNRFPGEVEMGPSLFILPSGPGLPNVGPLLLLVRYGQDPRPAGAAFQVKDIRINAGNRADSAFEVSWDVFGNESLIDHYEVYLDVLHLDRENPFGAFLTLSERAPRGARSCPPARISLPEPSPDLFVAPRVVAVPVNAFAHTAHERLGPALPLFPVGADFTRQPLLIGQFSVWDEREAPPATTVGLNNSLTVGGTDKPRGNGPAVWAPRQVESQNALLFDDPSPAVHVSARLQEGTRLRFLMRVISPFSGKRPVRVLAHLGFDGGPATSEVTATLQCVLAPTVPPRAPPITAGRPVEQSVRASDPTLKLLQTTVPPRASGYTLFIVVDLSEFRGDKRYAPTLLGVRALEE